MLTETFVNLKRTIVSASQRCTLALRREVVLTNTAQRGNGDDRTGLGRRRKEDVGREVGGFKVLVSWWIYSSGGARGLSWHLGEGMESDHAERLLILYGGCSGS